MDYDLVSKMRVEELKNFLRQRGLRITGRKEELVARVFAAAENNVQPVINAEEVERQIKVDYEKKLKIDSIRIPDPFKIPQGWQNEEEGIIFWPMLLYPDIFNYLMFYPSELGSKDLSDYKNSKAYSYYTNGWLQPLLYHPLSGSPYCVLKGECQKSQSIRESMHKLWIVVEKDPVKIRSCHCTCMAGMGQTCNHVASAMYRVEAAVRNGLTNPSCTSSANQWLPSRQEVVPTKLKNINFSRDDFAKKGKKKRPLVSTPKKKFNPIMHCTKILTLAEIAEALKDVAGNSIIHKAVPKPKIDFVREIIGPCVDKSENILSIDDILLLSENITVFQTNLTHKMTEANIEKIEVLTRGQSTNEHWYNFRKGVITASKAHEIKTKMEKVVRGVGGYINMWSLNQKVSGLIFVSPDIPALKYGRTMEEEAVNAFYNEMSKKHKNLNLEECGLFLEKDMPYVGGSPDRIVRCSCCKPACLEVKCPYSINYTHPQDPNITLPYLCKDDDVLTLKKQHKYYTQCQVQMAVTGYKHCFFMVWTPHGKFIEHITFDEKLWEDLKSKFKGYYNNFYLKTILGDVS